MVASIPDRGKPVSVCDDVEDLAGDEDDLADGLAFEVLGDLGAGEGGGFGGFLVGVLGDHEAVAELAVHLDDEFDFVSNEGFRVVDWPGSFGEKRGWPTGDRGYAGMDFLREVRGEGIEYGEELSEF